MPEIAQSGRPALMAHAAAKAEQQAVRAHLERRGWSLNRLAKEAEVSYGTLHAWYSGSQQSLRTSTAEKIAAALGISVDAMLGKAESAPIIHCVGRVGAGEAITILADSDAYPVPTPPGLRSDRRYECLEIVGRSMHPAQPGWLVFYEIEPRNPEDMIGHACVVETEDGRALFKVLRRYGDSQDRYTLESWAPGEPPIEGVKVRKAQRFAALAPRS